MFTSYRNQRAEWLKFGKLAEELKYSKILTEYFKAQVEYKLLCQPESESIF